MNRRQLILRAADLILILPAGGILLNACGTTTNPDTGGDLSFTSSSSGHTHTFTLTAADLSSPPAAGISRSDSTGSGHTHTVTLTQAQLQAISTGSTVEATAAAGSTGHTHTYTLVKS